MRSRLLNESKGMSLSVINGCRADASAVAARAWLRTAAKAVCTCAAQCCSSAKAAWRRIASCSSARVKSRVRAASFPTTATAAPRPDEAPIVERRRAVSEISCRLCRMASMSSLPVVATPNRNGDAGAEGEEPARAVAGLGDGVGSLPMSKRGAAVGLPAGVPTGPTTNRPDWLAGVAPCALLRFAKLSSSLISNCFTNEGTMVTLARGLSASLAAGGGAAAGTVAASTAANG
mmetsp:Transcript_36871/g.118660  ORF Transcript_36871/g.118660 Transcript_36871/m.118660 type:complete len:233 (-) Transcript_36871:52-750(-)